MASSAAHGHDAGMHAPTWSKIPAVVRWTTQHGNDEYLGDKHSQRSCPVTMDMHFDEAREIFSCKLSVPVKIKNHRPDRIYMYLLIGPSQVSAVDLCYDPVPQSIVNTFVADKKCSSPDDILALCFSLSTPASVAGPRFPIEPRSVANRRILEVLLLLGQADRMTIYFPSETFNKEHLLNLPSKTRERALHSPVRNIPVIDSLYRGKGGRIVHNLQDLSDVPITGDAPQHDAGAEWDIPPAYDQIAPAAAPYQAQDGKRSREASSSDAEKLPIKRRVCENIGSETLTDPAKLTPLPSSLGTDSSWKLAVTEQVALLIAQVASIREETRPRAVQTADAAVQTDEAELAPYFVAPAPAPRRPSTCSTVEDSLEDRLVIAEHTTSALREEMAQFKESIESRIMQSVRCAIQGLRERIDDRLAIHTQDLINVEEHLEEVQSGISGHVEELLDDMSTSIKVELRDYVKEEMVDVEDSIKGKLKDALNQATLSIDFDE